MLQATQLPSGEWIIASLGKSLTHEEAEKAIVAIRQFRSWSREEERSHPAIERDGCASGTSRENSALRSANSFPNTNSLVSNKSHPVLRRLYASIGLRVRCTRGFVRLICSNDILLAANWPTLCAVVLIYPALNASPR